MTTFTHPDAVGMDPKKLEQVVVYLTAADNSIAP
jgi:hypothetical protein